MRRRDKAGLKASRRRTASTRRDTKKSRRRRISSNSREAEVARLTGELAETREQQTATSDVLKVISTSTYELQTVFETLVESATRLCHANASAIWRLASDEMYHLAASNGLASDFQSRLKSLALRADGRSVVGRCLQAGKTVYVPNLVQDQEFAKRQTTDFGGYRGLLCVPLQRDDLSVGVLMVAHKTIRKFTPQQIALVENFAAQAVIAIENARLFNELRQRTNDLSESLEQQTASSQVLKTISSSPGELEPVFKTILENATRICAASFGNLYLHDEGYINLVASHNVPSAFANVRRGPRQYPAESALGKVIRTKESASVTDLAAAKPYIDRDKWAVEAVELGGVRSAVAVPLLKEKQLVGIIAIFRQEVLPFTDKQVDLVKNFAAQAVIAIENARLLNELRRRTNDLSEALEQQTATSDVLSVISTSPTDVNPVFKAMLESASRLCNSEQAVIFRFDGELLHLAATENWPTEALATYASRYPTQPSPHLTVGRVVLTKSVVIQEDTLADANYEHAVARAGGWRRMLGVPMLHDGNVIGVIVLAWKEPGPVLPRYVELLQTFAAQAVIAIENVRLFKELRERTHELAASLDNLRTTQDRLVQTQKLALLGQLTAGIAHEIKNPLNFVNNFSGISAELIDELRDTLKGVSLDDKARAEIEEMTDTLRGNFDKVVHHGKRADAIVKNMLQHSRESSGEHRVIDINALVEESLNLAWHGARAETQGFEIKLKQSFDPSAGGADVFPQDVRRALLNLISNGFYAATKRRAESNGDDFEPTLTASTKSLGDRVEIRIRDNGTGITSDVKEKMFEPFFTTKPTGEGTGLGLSISHDIIVKQHTGTIEVDTKPGEFTEIRIILPRVAQFV